MEPTKVTGRKNAFRDSGFTPERVRALYEEGKTDKEIGAMIGVSDVAVSWFRRKHGIQTRSQLDRVAPSSGKAFTDLSPGELSNLYLTMTDEAIGAMFGLSKTTVRKRRYALGVGSLTKSERSTKHHPLTDEQKEVVLGTLLGDGHLLDRGVLKVSHYHGQLQYLRQIHAILAPLSLPITYGEKQMDNGTLTFGFSFQTAQHSWFKYLRGCFYPEGRRVFPRPILENLTPRSLAYWYFDDGYLGDDHLPSFALGDVSDEEQREVIAALSKRFSLDIYPLSPVGHCARIGVRARSRDVFFFLVREYASPDMLYKIPQSFWPSGRKVVPRTAVRHTESYILPKPMIESAKGWGTLPPSAQDPLVRDFVTFWRKVGFPHPTPNPEELNILASLTDAHVIREGSVRPLQVGQSICLSFSRHLWDAKSYGKPSPMQLFEGDDTLAAVVRYILDQGDIPNAAELRSALRFWRRSGVYNFRPSAAKALVDRYCRDGGTVLDPCAGWGGRLMGTLLSKAGARYIGYEPSVRTVESLVGLHGWLASYVPSCAGRAQVVNSPAEDAAFPSGVDIVLTSPPYWKREVYDDAETQSAIRYPTYESWLHNFWGVVLDKSLASLRPGGWLLVNVDDFAVDGEKYALVEDTKKLGRLLGLGEPEVLRYELPRGDCEIVLAWSRGQSIVLPATPGVAPEVSACRSCGKVIPLSFLRGGQCAICLTPQGTPAVCRGCGVSFLSTRAGTLFHSEACYARYRRAQLKASTPQTNSRTFTCRVCAKPWSTEQKGNFATCPTCRDQRVNEDRKKTCQYRHCGVIFQDTSRKNTMKFCQEEHRRREKLFRAGVATDESYFRANHPVGQRTCQTCGLKFERLTGKSVRCDSCRQTSRHKACRKCGAAYVDETLKNTRRFCDACQNVAVVSRGSI